MNDEEPPPSARRAELLELAYRYVLDHGLVELSLRPLAAAIGSSPRVLLFLFGSKDGLIRALLARARADELSMLEGLPPGSLAEVAGRIWTWASDPRHRPVLVLWAQAYVRSLTEPDGPWAAFAQSTVDDWLQVLAAAQPAAVRRTKAGLAQRTQVLAVLRGAILDLIATGDTARTTAAVTAYLRTL
ncbi:MAG: TetR/AcrR family transcriptional regulator [Micromonosporaceae bacterium]|nr:TetR/AcrR family transcriptional regulator [Micromonosporaceae bacterium]